MTPEMFEETRRSALSSLGFEGEARYLADRSGGSPDRRTYALIKDRGTTPTVLVHGGLAEASVWGLVAGQIEGTVVLVDRPGCGLSSPIDYRGVDYEKHAADWLRGVLDELGAPTANLVGNSMGGFFSMACATAYPERVSRLVLPGAPAGLDRQLPLFLRLWGHPLLGHLIGALKFKDIETLRARVFASLVAHPERVPDPLLGVALAASGLPGVGLTSRTMLNTVSTLSGWRTSLLMRDRMANLRVPTLMLWGEADAFAPPKSGQDLAATMPFCRVDVLSDVGHIPQLDAPSLIADAVNAFCREELRMSA